MEHSAAISNSTPKVTVVVPVYNAASFIEKCSRSLFEQTLKEIEYIFIDDKSPDNSIEVLNRVMEDYPERKPYIRILRNSENQGVAAVREKAIKEATGEYIVHCDSDDWVDLELYERMYKTALRDGADIVFCDLIFEGEKSQTLLKAGDVLKSGKEMLKALNESNVTLYLPAKMIRRRLHTENDIYPWPGLNMSEDNALLLRLLYHAQRLSKTDGVAYHYFRMNPNSITTGSGEWIAEQLIENISRVSEFFRQKEDGEEFERIINIYKYMARLFLVSDSYKKYFKFLKTFPESKKAAHDVNPSTLNRPMRMKLKLIRSGFGLLYITLFKIIKLLKKRNIR